MTRTAVARLFLSCRVAAVAAVVLVAGAGPAAAQPLKGVLLDPYTPSAPGSDWFRLESLDLRGNMRPAFRVGFDWSEKPFVVEDDAGEDITSVVERQLSLHVGLGFNIAGRLRLAVDMPFVVDQPGASAEVGGIIYPDPQGPAVGDLRATADLRLLGEYGDPFTLAVGAHVFFPTGKQERYTSDGIARVMPRLMAAGESGVLAWAASAGMLSRDEFVDEVFQGVGMGHQLFAGAALGVRPVPPVLLGAELVAFTDLVHDDFLEKRATPLELLFSARFVIANQVRAAVGAGPGLTNAVGTPKVRAMATLEWFPGVPPADRDGDGVPDDSDACPDRPGERTGDAGTNGCPPAPPPDRDRDTVLDAQDACPDDPGVRSDNPATNGCPPPRDRDGDGVFDPADACPDEKGQKTDDPATSGCPPADRDKDGVLDKEDACPDKAGARTDDLKTSGCPDSDGDGILDPEDACPDQAGARDADPKKSGCPLARVERGQVRIIEQVKFKSGSSTILAESFPVLEAVAKILTEHPEIKKVRIEGHTDNRGGKAMNQRLSTRRAASVMKWLTGKGKIDKGRLTSQGLGMDRPLEDNGTEEGRRENRRVEFHIADPAPGAEAAPAPAAGAPPAAPATPPPSPAPSLPAPSPAPAPAEPAPPGPSPPAKAP
jgi:OmpA-OmpF porin, OOP family